MKKLFLLSLLSLTLSFAAAGQSGSTEPASNASTSEKQKKAIFRATKDQIKEVQQKLKTANLYSGEISGKLDDSLREQIKSWQKDNGLAETGTLNRATLEKMGVELTDKQKLIPISASSIASAESKAEKKPRSTAGKSSSEMANDDMPKRPAPFRANKEQIAAAQKILRDRNMLTGGEDGKLDDATRDGLGKYQEANNLKVTRTLNAATLEKMGVALTDAQKANVAAQAAYDAAKTPKN